MFFQDLKRGITSWAFWAAGMIFALCIICMVMLFTPVGEGAETPLNAFSACFLGEIAYLPALLCVLPLGTVFYDEWKSQYYRFAISRIGWRRFAFSRIATTAILGGVIVLLPTLVGMLYCYARFKNIPGPRDSTFLSYMCKFPIMQPWISGGIARYQTLDPLQIANIEKSYAVAWILRFFVLGACWAQLGLSISAWVDNWAAVLMLPLVLFMLIDWLANWLGQPYLSTRGMIDHVGGLLLKPYWVTAVLPIFWAALFVCIFMMGIRRRKNIG